MVWNSFSDFFYMGGYGLYVWGSVIVTFGFMLSETAMLKFRQRLALNNARRMQDLDADEASDSNDQQKVDEGGAA